MNNARLHIALLSEQASTQGPSGGMEACARNSCVAQLARALATAGHQVDVLTRRDAATLPAIAVLPRGVRVLHFDAGPPCHLPKPALLPHMAAFSNAAQRLFEDGPPYDVVHASFFMSQWVGTTLRARFGVPLVTTFYAPGQVRREHLSETADAAATRLESERRLVRQSDHVVTACPQDEASLLRLHDADPMRISSVPCGVDTVALRPGERREARQRLQLAQDEFVVLHPGRPLPLQGVDNLLQALALLPGGRVARPRLVVSGASGTDAEADAPEMARLRGLAAELGLAHHLQFTATRERVPLRDWYVAADVCVSTPWYEPLGLSALQAMACGVPVIASVAGAAADAVVDGVTGFLVSPHNPQVLAKRLAELRANPALGATLGRAGVRRVRSHFTWEQAALRLARIYAALPAQAPVPARADARRLHAVVPLPAYLTMASSPAR